MIVAEAMAMLFALYAAIGLAFAAWFVSFGIQRLDEAATGTSIAFRLLVLPGVAALWPYLLWRVAK